MAFFLRKRAPSLASRIRERVKPMAAVAAGGAAIAYFFDPQQGKGRRAKLRDMAIGRARGTVRQAERLGRKVASDAYGMSQRIRHRTPADPYPDDATLAQKVRSEILGWGGEYNTTSIIVNAENGVVVLRGQVDRPELVDKLEREVRRLPGVVDVENLVHIKGSAPVNKMEAVEASRGGLGPRA
jgi:osmotically-inducible protein OsmY